jgi:pteridine reductase
MQTKALAKEFAPKVRVNAVAPGSVAWPEGQNELSPDQKANVLKKTPLHRHGHAKNIAEGVLTLINNDFVTGQILAIDGGRSL